jgi:hypothetical protein
MELEQPPMRNDRVTKGIFSTLLYSKRGRGSIKIQNDSLFDNSCYYFLMLWFFKKGH